MIQLETVNALLSQGAIIRYNERTYHCEIVEANGTVHAIDNRTSRNIWNRTDLVKTETGSPEDGSRVITWAPK